MKRKSMRVLGCIILMAGIFGSVWPAWADWNPGDSYKWLQPPDPNPDGVSVRVNFPVTLADDFQCTESGLITDIHLWGSVLYDEPPPNAPFILGIWSNVPDGQEPFSHPGTLLWSMWFEATQYQVRPYPGFVQGAYFWDPLKEVDNLDGKVWQYNFNIDPKDAFRQTEGTIYWLSVISLAMSDSFGWKTTDRASRWNDGAVWGLYEEWDWQPLTYFPTHPYEGQSMDMAFVITPVPGSLLLLGSGLLGLVGWRFRRR
jgi:hypothetical protein